MFRIAAIAVMLVSCWLSGICNGEESPEPKDVVDLLKVGEFVNVVEAGGGYSITIVFPDEKPLRTERALFKVHHIGANLVTLRYVSRPELPSTIKPFDRFIARRSIIALTRRIPDMPDAEQDK